MLTSLISAGRETTAHLIGSALVLLLHRPRLWDALDDGPDLVGAVVEETLRYDGPVQGVFRRAVFDAQVGGVMIPAGARIFAAFGSAGRDGAAFDDPDEFAPGRQGASRQAGAQFAAIARRARATSSRCSRTIRRQPAGTSGPARTASVASSVACSSSCG